MELEKLAGIVFWYLLGSVAATSGGWLLSYCAMPRSWRVAIFLIAEVLGLVSTLVSTAVVLGSVPETQRYLADPFRLAGTFCFSQLVSLFLMLWVCLRPRRKK